MLVAEAETDGTINGLNLIKNSSAHQVRIYDD
jgi:hypothetical protein